MDDDDAALHYATAADEAHTASHAAIGERHAYAGHYAIATLITPHFTPYAYASILEQDATYGH